MNPSASCPNMNTAWLSDPQCFREGDYLTDQRRLYDVLDVLPAKLDGRAAILEDCRTLDATLFRPSELKRMRLRLVRRAPAGPSW